MPLSEKLHRLGEMDLPEIRFRASQRVRLARERWALSTNGGGAAQPWWQAWDPAKVAEPQLAEALLLGRGGEAADLLAGYFAVRPTAQFFFRADERAAIVGIYPRLFSTRVDEIRAAADAVCAHRFKIFAYPEIHAGEQIPWRKDLVHGIESGDEHGSRIPYLDFSRAGDSKIVWEPNRHQNFFTLGQAWILTGDERYAEECLAQIEDWLRANPYPRGINWASSLEAAFRVWSWLWALSLLAGSKALSGARLGTIGAALAQHADFIAANLSTYFSPNTHLLGEGFALFAVGLLLPELRGSSGWLAAGRAILISEITNQVRPDGAHMEQSSCYHRYAMEFFLCAALLAERNGCAFPDSYLQQLDRMFEFSMETAWPSGRQPMTGDADGGQLLNLASRAPNNHRPLLAVAAAWRHRGDFARAAGQVSEEALWLLGPSAPFDFANAQQSEPAEAGPGQSRVFRDSGAVVQRSGAGTRARYLFFDAGPQGMDSCAHGHADALQILCAADGVEWLIDPGTSVYTSSREWRDFFRSTRAHSTVTLDGRDQAEPFDFFKWRGIPKVRLEQTWMLDGIDGAIASHTGYTRLPGGGIHRRSVIFLKPDYWLISDTVEGHGSHAVEFSFHFAPGVALSLTEAGALAAKDGEEFLLQGVTPGAALQILEGAESPAQGWYSEDYGHRVRAPVLSATVNTPLPVSALWLLWPSPAGGARLHALNPEGARGTQAIIETQAWTDHLSLRASEDASDGRGLSTDADLAFLRRATSGDWMRLALAGGCCADFGSEPLVRAESWLDALEVTASGDSLDIHMRPLRSVGLRWPGAKRVRVNNREVATQQNGDWINIPGEK